MEPSEDQGYEFVNAVRGGAIPTEFIAAVEKGLQACLAKGLLLGFRFSHEDNDQ